MGTRHGLAMGATRKMYDVWLSMIRRCTDPTSKDYKYYGAKGVRVCAAWLADCRAFIADVGSPPSPRHTLDRRDTTGDYEPGNVRWATRREQAVNRCSTRMISFRGETMCTRDWARRLGIPQQRLSWRLNQGWPIEKVLQKERVK